MSGIANDPSTQRSYGRITAVGVALLGGLAALIFAEPRWNLRLQTGWLDTYQRIKPRDVVSAPATIVAIDERSLARLGQWPWPRTVLAELLRDIESYEPSAIGLDVMMPEPDRLSPERLLPAEKQKDPLLASRLAALPSNDSELAHAIAAGPVVLALAGLPAATGRTPLAPPFVVFDRGKRDPASTDIAANLTHYDGALTNIEELESAAAGHGAISAGRSDEVIRQVSLVTRVADRLVPSLAIEMLRVALHAPAVRMYTRGPNVESVAIGDFVTPTDANGELRVYYSQHNANRYVSAVDVLDGKVDPQNFRRKLVLVGNTGLGGVDYPNTPLSERMPGIEIHAQLLENLYDQTWLTRPIWARWVELAVFVLLGFALIWATPRLKPVHAGLLALGFIGLPLVGGFAAFAWGRLLFDAASPALFLLVLFSVLLVLTLTEAGRQRRALEQAIRKQREQAAYVAGELEAAKRIQVGFLPSADLLRGDGRVEIAASMAPAREVGGDLYDYFLLDDNRLFFLIGDVAGKGLSAGLFMAVSKALYKSTTLRSPQATIGGLMRAANDEVSRDNPEMFFVTAFAGILDLQTGELAYCNAGHVNPYLLSGANGKVTQLCEGAGPPLCAVDHFEYVGARCHMRAGDVICLVTDGVIDAQSPTGDRYGNNRIKSALIRQWEDDKSARALVDVLCDDAKTFAAHTEPADDFTVLVLRWLGPASNA